MAKINEAKITEWTIMFYFAGDNELAPIVVSLLKAIKDAGFQKDTDVLVYFDPNEVGVPTKVYDVYRKQKKAAIKDPRKPGTRIGDGADPFVRNIEEDRVKPEEIIVTPDRPASAKLQKALIEKTEMKAEEALENFIGFCREAHRARHYILFLAGHGMVVGSDAFLPDDNPVSAITLKKLGEILKGFTTKVKRERGAFELLGLHSCCMSAIEVAYELKGTAKYMLASEGPTFLGDWHIRQLLKKTFNVAESNHSANQGTDKEGADQDEADGHLKILELIRSLYFLTLFSGTDYLHVGYSHDLALCNLDPTRYKKLTTSVKKLVALLKKGLNESSDAAATPFGKRVKDLVLLAHWEAQSYWGENYTDLFDFCRCLLARCDQKGALGDLYKACYEVMTELTPITSGSTSDRFKSLVIYTNNFGWEFQYSHGLSVYFPWSIPVETKSSVIKDALGTSGERFEDQTEKDGILDRYREYAFTKELMGDSWLSFLKVYFKKTERKPRRKEDKKKVEVRKKTFREASEIAEASFDPFGTLSRLDDPVKPRPSQGPECNCVSIKNYPRDKHERVVNGKVLVNLPAFSMTEGVVGAFKEGTFEEGAFREGAFVESRDGSE